MTSAPDLDEWDRWNYDRTAQLGEAPRSAQYVPRDVAGVDDLDRYGEWRDEPRYGHVWVPRDVTPDWVPYSTGRWVYDPYYEWTWVDEAPWGWAPYHYGRWVHGDRFWGWAPGPLVVAPVYAPALVAFFGVPGVSVSVSAGLPFVSWVPLGFGEPVIPWWGGARFVGRPSWDGWGGRRIVNNVVVNNTTIVNVRNIHQFQNLDVPGAVVGVNRERFGRGRVERVHLDSERIRRLQPVVGQLGVTPVAASLVPKEGRGHQPPERLHGRPVVATRPAQDPTERLRAKGLNPVAPVAAPQSRIVKPRRGPQGGPPQEERGQRPASAGAPGPGGVPDTGNPPPPDSHGERRGHGGATTAPEHAVPPPPPRRERQQPGGASAPAPAGAPDTGNPPPPDSHGERRGHGSATTAPEHAAPPPPAQREQPRSEQPARTAPPSSQVEHRRSSPPGVEGAPPPPPPPQHEGSNRGHDVQPSRGEQSGRHAPMPEAAHPSREAPGPPAGREQSRHKRSPTEPADGKAP